ncbi:DUF3140 domain-containing protein [Phormidium sp. LEGE 05292]|uniref:DUF3140 domain-containing protein n=1 Tax=[Phormidium] sp. LEGE 05292 TaxID=767427 RepID=UPI0018821433|nr:DUF3140 domain-containing protein [Phormidium sp. LEGE 05292]MBE9226637.1 DUF3140 domain-containing protein [Phormidium sp. LEGE 05292]
MSKDSQAVIEEFQQNVNMTAKEIESWLKTDESKSVGKKEGNQESIGHESGRHIVEILQKKEGNYTEDDLSQMQRVVSYIKRHSAQKPSSDIEDSRWRYSLMNWGHDPLK